MTNPSRLITSSSRSRRPDLSDPSLRILTALTLTASAGFLVASPYLPAGFPRPGSAVLQSAAITGSLFLLAPAAFAIAKRSGRVKIPNRWLIAHIVMSLLGLILVVAHTTGKLASPPGIMAFILLALVISGAAGRLTISRSMAATFGTKLSPFGGHDLSVQRKVKSLIQRKTKLLAVLDPSDSEATFSVTLNHWLGSPRRAFAYARLAREEARLIGARGSVSPMQGFWRPFHLLLAWVFMLALLVHVITVTFFAGYVAGDREIYWWYLTAW
jgi:hypothetical protein